MKKGNYIIFEGIENSGKTTQSKILAGHLRSIGERVIETREPGGTNLGRDIRRILLNKTSEIYSPEAELFLFEADRAELFKQVIIPSLERGEQVITDRSYWSTESYQGYGRGMNLEMIRNFNKIATYGTKPDLAFIFDMPVEEALASKTKKDRMESLGMEFHNKVRHGFLEIAAKNKDICILIERGNRGIEEISEEVKYNVKERLGLRNI